MIAKEFSLAWQREIDVSASIPKGLCIDWTRTDLPSLSEEIANRLRIVLTLTWSVQHFATLLKCVSCQIVPKTVVGQANASLEKPLCITVWTSHCEVCPRTFLPPVKHNTWEGAWAEVWFLAKCAIVVRELATQPGKPWVRVHQFLSFCTKPSVGRSCLLVHYVNTVGTASIEHVAVRRRRRVDDEVKLTC